MGFLVGKVEGYDVEHEYDVIKYEIEQSIALSKAREQNDLKVMFKPINLRRAVCFRIPCQISPARRKRREKRTEYLVRHGY